MPAAPIFSNPLFPPGVQPDRFSWWLNKGLYRIGDYFDHKDIHLPSQFMESLEMPPTESFHLQQIYHFLKSLQDSSDLTV